MSSPFVGDIREIRNHSNSPVTVRNLETPANTDHGLGDFQPGESRFLDISIPWCIDGKGFDQRHIVVTVGTGTAARTFVIWQRTSILETNHADDRVCISTDGAWHNVAAEIGGYATVNPLGDDRVLLITDAFLSLLPLGSPILTTIVEIRNASAFPATVHNREKPGDTNNASGIVCQAGESLPLGTVIPWCDGSGFNQHHIEVTVGSRTFSFWQAMRPQDLQQMRVRVSTLGAFDPAAPEIGGYAAVGPIETGVFGDDRVLVINDASLWLLPSLLVEQLKIAAKSMAADGFHVCDDRQRAVPSVPKLSATAFSMAGIPSDAFDLHQPGARFLYRDSGKRYEFAIANGAVVAQPSPPLTAPALTQAISFNRLRRGEPIPLPHFDLVAANGGRLFAKEKDSDRFYFAILDEMFIHDTPSREFPVPSTYFKLDPEFNQPPPLLPKMSDVMAHLDGDFAGHPAAMRFPLFRVGLGFGVMRMFDARVTRGVWHLLDTRPPRPDLFIALTNFIAGVRAWPGATNLTALLNHLDGMAQKLFASPVPTGTPSYSHVQYCSSPPLTTGTWEPSIDFTLVLDIGVGHVHCHQQYERITGGELQMLKGSSSSPVKLFKDNKSLYQFMNGPIADLDGFNDGTCNYYVLAQLKDATFALLYLDEQSFFSGRWRLANTEDFSGSLSLTASLDGDESASFGWNKAQFWSPFAQPGLIGKRSRMAVSAQVVLITGDIIDPVPPDLPPGPLIYSINFSWGTMDRTWRWRALPVPNAGVRRFPDPVDGAEVIRQEPGDTAYPQSIRLRDDMTIHIKGTSGGQIGRWYQRYLPASNGLVPAAGELVASGRPAKSYSHPWKFLPESVFRLADLFSHFGVYDQVDSRTQYYPVDPASYPVLDGAGIAPDDWWVGVTDPRPESVNSQPFITASTFRFDTLAIPWPPWPPFPTAPLIPSSAYNENVLLRFVRRGSRWIAIHADKRDDDMELFDHIPPTVTLQRRARDGASRTGSVTVALQPGVRIEGPPAVERAYFWWVDANTAGVAISLPLADGAILDNVTRVRMAALDIGTGVAIPLLDAGFEGFRFNKTAQVFEFHWTAHADVMALLRTLASTDDAIRHGVSIWFEDVTGHVAPPEQVFWMTHPPEMRVVVDPVAIPLGLPCSVTVTATDANTGALLPPKDSAGSVTIEGDSAIYKLGASIHKTFSLIQAEPDPPPPGGKPRPLPPKHPPTGTVSVDRYPDTPIPFSFYNPRLNVHVNPAPVPAGRPVQISVDVRDAQTNALVAASLAVVGDPVGPANSPIVSPILSHTFQPGVTTVRVSAAEYPDASFTVTAYAPALTVTVIPPLPGLGKPVNVTVHAVDSTLGTVPSGCRVWIDGKDIESTDKAFSYIFRARKAGPPTNPSFVYPAGVVKAAFYPDTAIDFGFDSTA